MKTVNPTAIEAARKLPMLGGFTYGVARYTIAGIRIANKTGTSVIVRLAHGKDRKELRLSRHYMGSSSPIYSTESHIGDVLLRAFAKDGGDAIKSDCHRKWHGTTSFINEVEAAILIAMCEISPEVKKILTGVEDFLRTGTAQEKSRAHNRSVHMKQVKTSLTAAMFNGTTREEVIALMDEILVEEVMTR